MVLKDLVKVFDELFNKSSALAGDPVGLQIGQLNNIIDKALLTLDVTDEVVKEAIDKKADLIIAHHPLIFDPLTDIVSASLPGRKILDLIGNNIAVYIAHTNFDAMPGGLNEAIAEKIGLKNIRILENEQTRIKDAGLGRYGKLDPPQKLVDFMKKIKEHLKIDNFRWAAPSGIDFNQEPVKTVAVINGSANSFMDSISLQEFECDLLIVGELKYNKVLDIIQSGKILLELGHGESEKMSMDLMYDKINEHLKKSWGLELIKSKQGYANWRYHIV